MAKNTTSWTTCIDPPMSASAERTAKTLASSAPNSLGKASSKRPDNRVLRLNSAFV